MVLDDKDFGKAYFTDGWATHFLTEVFANYTVLFIGYSVNDPVIRYLSLGLHSNGPKHFIFLGHNNKSRKTIMKTSWPISNIYSSKPLNIPFRMGITKH